MAMIYALGNISGAHLSPAVTIAFILAKKFEVKQVAPYIISQLVGAFLATILGAALAIPTWKFLNQKDKV